MKATFKQTVAHTLADGPAAAFKSASKGQMRGVDSLGPLALAIVSLAIIVGIGAIVLNEMSQTVNDTDATSVLDTGVSALQTFSDFFTVIVVIGIAAVLFLLLQVVRGAGSMGSARA